MNTTVRQACKRLPLALAVVAALQMAPAFAQAQTTTDQTGQATSSSTQKTTAKSSNEQKKAKKLQTITVTGSLIQQPENESVSPVQTVNIETNIKTGSFDTAGILMGTAIASGSTQINGQFGGFIVNGGTGVESVNLRGLGAGRTLVLLDGQRPGPAGTRGQVSAFDLNVVPVSIIQRIDIVKDGSSSIYGSDAVAGVVNIITKKEFDKPTFNFRAGIPQHGGGEQYTAAFADGWNFDNGNILVAAQVDRQNALKYSDRSFLSCPRDRVWGADGKRADLPDHSINAGTKYAGCDNMLYGIYVDALTGNRLVPTADGSTGPNSPFPGYKLHQRAGFDPSKGEVPYLDQPTDAAFLRNAYAIQEKKRASFYFASNLNFGNIGWDTQLLYSYRKTNQHGWRQFFPAVTYPYGSTYPTTAQGVYEPVMPFPSDSHVKVDYLYGATKLTGILPWTESWTWEANATYTKSRGMYNQLGIDARISGDLTNPSNQVGNPPISLYQPGLLNGSDMQQLVDTFGLNSTGHTTFTQETANVLFTGDLFHWWAGTAQAAFGAEFRHKALNDIPSESSQNNWQWGLSSAGITQGTDNVKEIFTQFGIPLIKGVPGIDKLSLDLSAREFRYNSVGAKDNVWRAGLNWQITPTFRVRGTLGTSYKAPSLFQLYLADQTGFVAQNSIDPCSEWGESNNQHVRANCAAAGIPPTYNGAINPTATTHSGGGKGFLTPEGSRAKTVGFVWTPSFTNMSLSLDYFDYQIHDEITRLSAGTIVGGCYTRAVYPNKFCDQLKRNAPDATTNPNMITDVYATYTNINRERDRGYDLFGRWGHDFSFGHMSADLDVVYTLSDVTQLFSTSEASGFTNSNRIGYIGNPHTTAVAHISWSRGNWSVDWQGQYVGSTQDLDDSRTFAYFGDGPMVTQDIKAGWQIRHDISVSYERSTWGITAGIRNVFDQEPNQISATSGDAVIGNTPLYASQYDWFGRTFFANLRFEL